MYTTTKNYKKTHGKLVIGGQPIVREDASELLGTAIQCDGGWFEVTVLFVRRDTISYCHVLGGVKISAKKAAEVSAIAAIKQECEHIALTCPRYSGDEAVTAKIAAKRIAFDAAKAQLAAFDAARVADVAINLTRWSKPSHLLGN